MQGHPYICTFIDNYSRYLHIVLLKAKNQVFKAFKTYKASEEAKYNNKYKISTLVCDNRGEYLSDDFKVFLNKEGITYQLSSPYTPEQNGLAERLNQTLIKKTRSLIFKANIPLYLWGEAALAAVYIYNRSPHKALNYKTPYEYKYNKKPDISHKDI